MNNFLYSLKYDYKALFESYGWLSTLLAENDSITFIKSDGEEVTRTVSNNHSEVDISTCIIRLIEHSFFRKLKTNW